MNKNARKLIPAVAMLLVSASMLSTASYAWFSMNTQVSASGMQVKAVAPKSLFISDSANGTFKSDVTLAADNTPNSAFFPVKETKTEAGKLTFEKLSEDSMKYVGPDGKIDASHTPTYEATTVDFFHDQVFLKLEGKGEAETETISVQATLTYAGENPDEIYKAVHIGVLTGTGTYKEISIETLATPTTAVDLTTLTYNAATATTVELYAWFDGEDDDCKNSNSVNTQMFSIAITFAIKAKPAV